MEIGIRALRDGLSGRLDEVKRGHVITVTEHGRPIARIVPVGVPTALERLRAEGRVSPQRQAKGSAPTPVSGSAMVSDLISDQRR